MKKRADGRYSKQVFIGYKPAAGGFAVPVNSEYPDVAVKLINLLSTKEGIELYKKMMVGIDIEKPEKEKA